MPRQRDIQGSKRGGAATTVRAVLGLVLVALSLGASNFAASIGIGLGGVDRRTRIRVALVFGLFEAAMPLVGLGLGRTVSQQLGSTSHAIGAGLLIAVGSYTVVMGIRPRVGDPPTAIRLGRLLVSGLALSVDNLVVGFARDRRSAVARDGVEARSEIR